MGSIIKQIKRYVEKGEAILEEKDGAFVLALTRPHDARIKEGHTGLWINLVGEGIRGTTQPTESGVTRTWQLKGKWLNADRIKVLKNIIDGGLQTQKTDVPPTNVQR